MAYQSTLHSPKRWAAADIDYVRTYRATRSAGQIAKDLNEPVKRVRSLMRRLDSGGHRHGATELQVANSVQIVFKGPRSGPQGVRSTGAGVQAANAPEGAVEVPPDLHAFVQSKTVTEVARALGMSRRTAHRIRLGYWPGDDRALLAAWATYCGRSAQQQSGWFLRRVHAGGLVRHAGIEWTATGLAARTGQTLAVARAVGDALLAQTLELPSQRLALAPVPDGGAA